MPEEEIKKAVRDYIDSIKDEPWYDISYDDIILEGWTKGAEWYRNRIRKTVEDLTIVNV